MQNTAKTKSTGVVIAGVVIVALALLIIFLSVFLPRMRENKIFRERIGLFLTAAYERMLVSDPLLEDEGFVAERGVEVMLTSTEVEGLREKLRAVNAAGFVNAENTSMIEGAWDTKWQLRTAAGEYVALYFTERAIYFYADATAFYFEPKDLTAYDVFYTALREALTK